MEELVYVAAGTGAMQLQLLAVQDALQQQWSLAFHGGVDGFNLSGGSCQLSASLLLVQHAGPDRSIIKQSYDARERLQDPSLPNHLGFGNLNGDGFGIGWYAPDDLREGDPTPCMYKSITPAW